jgi:hypothetical protein
LPPARAAAPYRILLRGGQHLTGELVGLDSDKVQLRTAWSDALSIPRAAVVAVNHAPGFVTVFVDDFEKELKSWRLAGTPALTTRQHVSGQRSLCFNGQGQAEFTISEPLSAGRAGINFHDGVQAKGLSWQFEAEFANSVGWPTVHVRSDPQAGKYWGELSGPVAAKSQLPRQEGWQRLTMEFGSDTLVLSIDDAILLSCRQPAAGGALRKVRLRCTVRTSESGGEVFFDDFSLARAVPDLPHLKTDSEQDELWLLSGDQLFGDVADATGGKIRLRAGFGSRSISWGDVRGIYFRQSGPTRKPDSKMVRLWLRSGIGFEPDVLEGVVRRLDKHRLVLSHEALGELEIERKRLHRLKALAP